MIISKIINKLDAIGRNKQTKDEFLKNIKKILKYHFKNCFELSNFYKKQNINLDRINDIENLPFIPVKIFKKIDLKSVDDKKVFKILRSSGTSGDTSKIYLDKANSLNQTRVLNKIITFFFGKERLPMLILDSKKIFSNRNEFSARAAAFLGFSFMGKDHTFLLKDDLSFDIKTYKNFINKYHNQKFLIFSLTNLVWEKFLDNKYIKKEDLSKCILLHGGGWKKLEKLKITNNQFKKRLFKKFKLKAVHNYYGMVEQTGSIFIECNKCGSFITSNYSDIIIRGKELEILKPNKVGFVQLLSLIPTSYPGNSLLTDDLGVIIQNNCSCKKLGKQFLLKGRIANSEIRGCSNV